MANPEMKLNRTPLCGAFSCRGTKVKWPTLRKARITDKSRGALRELAKSYRSEIFLTGEYRTNLNFGRGKNGPFEVAAFFEREVRTDNGALYLLVWVGNYYDGAVFHCGWQYPHARLVDNEVLERVAVETYMDVAIRLYEYSDSVMDPEVEAFFDAQAEPECYLCGDPANGTVSFANGNSWHVCKSCAIDEELMFDEKE